MAKITLKGSPIDTVGTLPAKGQTAPPLTLVRTDLSTVSLADYAGKKKVVNIFPSIDTGVCAASVRAFHKQAAGKPGVVVLNVSADLPFAHKRFCGAEGIDGVESLSTFRAPSFGADWGVTMTSGPFAGLLSRAVVVLDEADRVLYAQQVPEIAEEPDYAGALAALEAT